MAFVLRRNSVRLSLLACAALGAGACGGDNQDTDTSVSSPTTATTSSDTTEGPTSTTESETTSPTDASETDTDTASTETTDPSTDSETDTATTDPATTDTTTTEPTGPTSDTDSTDTESVEDCEAPGILEVCDQGLDGSDVTHAFWAIGVGCPDPDPNDLSEPIPISNRRFAKFQQWNNPESWRVAAGFGSHEENPGELLFRPREGERFLIVSTGRLSQPDADGVVTEAPGSQYNNNNNLNDDLDALPAPLSPLHGSNDGMGGDPFVNCDGVNDCSDSILDNWLMGEESPQDVLSYAFDVEVPAGTGSFGFDFVFFSSEYPDFVGEPFNDMFIAWSTSEAFTGNISFFADQPLTVTSLALTIENGYEGNDPELAGTGFEGYGATKWASVNAKVMPGETFTFAFAIMDMHDSNKATVAIIDNWHWGCKECELFEVNPNCGMDDNPPCCGVCIDPSLDPQCSTEGHPLCCPE
ncbi:MAG: choice-of-anchor L domain-containing protein [Myxococcales bacterium]|nr:choice-of-anchor L domain-containing protein [Myxococcales bacterium]